MLLAVRTICLTSLASRFHEGARVTYFWQPVRDRYFVGTTQEWRMPGDLFRFIDREGLKRIETIDGERWKCHRLGPVPSTDKESILTVTAQLPLPAARLNGVYNGWTNPWGDPSRSAAAMAREGLGLSVSPRHFVRWDGCWWHPHSSSGDRLYLGRLVEGCPRWAVLEASPYIGVEEISRFEPVASPTGSSKPRLIFERDEWARFCRLRDYSLFMRENDRLRLADVRRWMAVRRVKGGRWMQLTARERVDSATGPGIHLQTQPRPWKRVGGLTIPTHHPDGRSLFGLATIIEYEGGKQVTFILPHPEASDYKARLHGRPFPSLDQWADLYGRIPRQALDSCVNIVEVHTSRHSTDEGPTRADYTRDSHRVRHYPPFLFDLIVLTRTILHEAIGHGRAPHDGLFRPFTKLWVSAMLADGTSVHPRRKAVEEDFAHTVEDYWQRANARERTHRFAVLDRILPADGGPITRRTIETTLASFHAVADRLVFGGLETFPPSTG